MTSRVIRPTRIMEDPYQVVVPKDLPVENDGTVPELTMEALHKALSELKETLASREEAHASEIAQLMKRIEAEVEEQIADAVNSLTGTVDRISAERIELIGGAEQAVLKIAIALAERIVKEKVEIDEEAVLQTVREALSLAADRQEIVLRVHPDDLALVKEHQSDWLAKLDDADSIRMEGDSRVTRGGCLVETETGEVDGRIEKQFQTMTRTLIESTR